MGCTLEWRAHVLLVSLSRNKTQESTCMKTATVKTPDTPRIFQIVSIPAARRGMGDGERQRRTPRTRSTGGRLQSLKYFDIFGLLVQAVRRAARETNKMSEPEGGLRLLYGWFGYHPTRPQAVAFEASGPHASLASPTGVRGSR